MGRFTGLLGLIVIMGSAWLCSTHKRHVKLRIIAWGLGLQFAFAIIVLKTPASEVLRTISTGVAAMFGYAEAGSTFVFGPLGTAGAPVGFVFAFQVLPIIIFIASFFAILYHLGIMQRVVKGMAIAMQKVMGVSGAESLNVAASIFMGQTEAPLTIKPFLAGMTESELFTIMTCGMAHVSGAVMAAYVGVGHVEIRHLLTAVIMTAPATIMLAKIFIPETDKPVTAGKVEIAVEKSAVNVIDAAAQGAGDGLRLVLNIGAMLIAFLALIALVNGVMGWGHAHAAWFPESLQKFFGWIFAPVAWVLGVPWQDAGKIGSLLGTRLITNEMVAFQQLGPMKGQLAPQSFTIATFALCGFANLSSIAIQIGGIGALAPNRKSDLARLGLRAVLAGTMANFMSACIAGMFL
ncbi:MAG TPA: nucleoside transporter C-terminal domain-containing protein [Candidatus Sulfopaludibacter sp.]|nr:nucleoside transporter C-terminal domain-containing protein [Candidatus Sulfopaludibacter sp.]